MWKYLAFAISIIASTTFQSLAADVSSITNHRGCYTDLPMLEFQAEDSFLLKIPRYMHRRNIHGTDTYVQQFRGRGDGLEFDYGPYGLLEKEPTYSHWEEDEITVDGKKATIALYEGRLKEGGAYRYMAAIFFPKLDDEGNKLLVTLRFAKKCNRDAWAYEILQSIEFLD